MPRRTAVAPEQRAARHDLRLFIVDDLLFVAADTRIAPDPEESVMRHFLTLALTPPTLAPRMMQPAVKACLIAPTRRPHAFAPCLSGTGIGAVSLPVIATPANAPRALATGTIEYSVDDRTGSSLLKAGQLVPTASFSQWDKRYRRSAQTPRRLEDGNSSGLHLCSADLSTTLAS